MSRTHLRLIVQQILTAACTVSALTVAHSVKPDAAIKVFCDQVTWTDASGQSRTACMETDTVDPAAPTMHGGQVNILKYMNGSTQKQAYGFSGWSFGASINHGGFPGSCSGSWIQSSCDAFGDTSKFIFKGAHHAVWQYKCKVSFFGAGTAPFMYETRQYTFCDGQDQLQYAISFDVAHLPTDSMDRFWDARTPYCDFNWWGDAAVYPKNTYTLGTTYKGVINTNTMQFDLTTPYNLCPYVTGYYADAGFDDEFGMVQTRLNTHHFNGRDAVNSGKSGTINGVDCFDDQLSDYQGWTGGRICWQADKPDGQNQFDITYGTESYSLTAFIGRHSDGSAVRIINEANAIQNSGTTLTAATGSVQTRGIEGVGLNLTRSWDKPGFDQVYRTWNFVAANNVAEGTLTLQAGQSLKNPTFVVENYTANTTPAVLLNGTAQTDGSGCWISVDTAAHRAWITFNATFSGAQTVRFAGPTDQTGITFSSISVTPGLFLQSASQQVSVNVSTTGSAPISRVEIDCRSLGGNVATMPGSGTSYSYSVNVPTGYPEGNRRIIVKALSASGTWREADTFVTIKRPDLPLYCDGSTGTASTWTGNMLVAEKSTNASEGSKQMEFTFNNGVGAHGGIDFNVLKDLRQYKYLVFAYKGPSTGRSIDFTIGSASTFSTNRYTLPSVTNWTLVALPMRTVTQHSAFTKKSAQMIHFWMDTTGGAGTFNFDNFYATSLPGTIPQFPTGAVKPISAGSVPSRSVMIRVCGRTLNLQVPPRSSVELIDLKGHCVSVMTSGNLQRAGSVTIRSAGVYLVRTTVEGARSVRSVTVR